MRTSVRERMTVPMERPRPRSLPRAGGRAGAGLRRAGVAVSSGETIDAVRALAELERIDRGSGPALRGCLVKDEAHLELFERLYDALFPRLRITATSTIGEFRLGHRRPAGRWRRRRGPAALRTQLAEALKP